jgi:tripartite-type tricarboxylate transporter receptor subunit TctC
MRGRAALVALAAAIAGAPGAWAAEARYPAQQVQVIMPFSAGGGVDIVARALAAGLGERFGQPFVVTTRDGAAGAIGFAALAQAKPDGYTLASSPATPMTNVPHLQKGLPYGFDSFVPICQTFENVFSIAVPLGSPYRVLRDLLDDARARPGQVFYGSVGLGSIPHLSAEALAKAAGVRFTLVPYRGDAPMLPHLLSSEIAFSSISISTIVGQALRVLVVFGNRRDPSFPAVPASSEFGAEDVSPGLNGLFAPRGTPEATLDVLERGCAAVAESAAFRAQIERLNGRVAFLDRAAFTARLRADYEAKGRLIHELGLAPQ